MLSQTDSRYTCLMSGSGHSGMEALIANLLEPGETIVVGNHGIWGERVIDIADRYGGNPSVSSVYACGWWMSYVLLHAVVPSKPTQQSKV